MPTSDAVLDKSMWKVACAAGTLLGCVLAFLCATVLHQLIHNYAVVKEKDTTASSSQRAHVAKVHGEHTHARAATSTVSSKDESREVEGDTVNEDDWESTTTCTSSPDSDSDEVDIELQNMEALQLKMVFVVRNQLMPKITAQEVVALTVSAGVELVELVLSEKSVQKAVSGSASRFSGVASSQDRQRWRSWYRSWNRVGCGKITLKSPDKETMDHIVAMAQEHRLPMVHIWRSDAPGAQGTQALAVNQSSDLVVVALGPAPSAVLEPITGSLKLYS